MNNVHCYYHACLVQKTPTNQTGKIKPKWRNKLLVLRLTVLTIVFQITGVFKSKKTRKVAMEQAKPASLEQVPEEPSDPLPSVVVDHDRLKVTEQKNKLYC